MRGGRGRRAIRQRPQEDDPVASSSSPLPQHDADEASPIHSADEADEVVAVSESAPVVVSGDVPFTAIPSPVRAWGRGATHAPSPLATQPMASAQHVSPVIPLGVSPRVSNATPSIHSSVSTQAHDIDVEQTVVEALQRHIPTFMRAIEETIATSVQAHLQQVTANAVQPSVLIPPQLPHLAPTLQHYQSQRPTAVPLVLGDVAGVRDHVRGSPFQPHVPQQRVAHVDTQTGTQTFVQPAPHVRDGRVPMVSPHMLPAPSALPYAFDRFPATQRYDVPSQMGQYTPGSIPQTVQVMPFAVNLILPHEGMILDPTGVYLTQRQMEEYSMQLTERHWIVPHQLLAVSDGEIRRVLGKGIQRQQTAPLRLKDALEGFNATYEGTADESFPAYVDAVVTHVNNMCVSPAFIVHVIAKGLRGVALRSYNNWSSGLNREGCFLALLPPNHVVAALTLAFWHRSVQNRHIALLQRTLKQRSTESNREFLHRFTQETNGLHMSDSEMIAMMRESVDATRFQLPFPSHEDVTFDMFLDMMDRSAVTSLNAVLLTPQQLIPAQTAVMTSPPLQVNRMGPPQDQQFDVRAEFDRFKRDFAASNTVGGQRQGVPRQFVPRQNTRTISTSAPETDRDGLQPMAPVTCFYCERPNHSMAECYRLKADIEKGVVKRPTPNPKRDRGAGRYRGDKDRQHRGPDQTLGKGTQNPPPQTKSSGSGEVKQPLN